MAEMIPVLQFGGMTAASENISPKKHTTKEHTNKATVTGSGTQDPPAAVRESDGKLWSEILLTQRKIKHLLRNEGMGKTFRYYPDFNPDVGFEEGDDVWITEKYDGTTMQATSEGFFKRFDNFKKRSKKKFSASEKERYRLEKLDLDSPSNQYIKQAVEPFLENFRRIEEGYCVYFEACSPRIGVRFHTSFIRVFDTSRIGERDFAHEWLSFATTLSLCGKWGLPCVAHRHESSLSLQSVLNTLAEHPQYEDLEGELEGYVIRNFKEGFGRIAKVRCDDLPKIEYL